MSDQARNVDPTAGKQTPMATVEAFLAALAALDVEAARELMAPDISYQNVPLPPVRGPDETARVLESFLAVIDRFEVENVNIAQNGDVVLTERIDSFVKGAFRADIWVCGTFEVRDGRITLWRDYFDIGGSLLAVLRGLARVPVRWLRA